VGESFRCQPAFGIERGHAAGAGRGHRLAMIVVRHIAGSEHTLDTRVRVIDLRPPDVALLVQRDLPSRESVFGVWPIAANIPAAVSSSVSSSTVLFSRTPVTPSLSLPNTSVTIRFHFISILGLDR
jgi:hypothetical protein